MTSTSTHNEKHPCAGKSVDGRASYPCAKNGTHLEHDKWWCGTHAPSKVAARRQKRNEAYKDRRDADHRVLLLAEQRCADLAKHGIEARPEYSYFALRHTGGVTLTADATGALINRLERT